MSDDFPKNRGEWSGIGRTMARRLGDEGDDAWLRARRFGATARNKGGYLVVTKDPDTRVVAPFLWAQIASLTSGLSYRSFGWGARRTTNVSPAFRTPAFAITGRDWYVGDGYVLQHSIDPSAETGPQDAPVRKSWLSIVNVKDKSGLEALSLSGGNVAGATVSFFDAETLPMRSYFLLGLDHERPHPWVSGWNGQGYAFGFIGRKMLWEKLVRQDRTLEDDGFQATFYEQYALRASWGDTGTRRMQHTDLQGAQWTGSPFFAIGTSAPGRLQGLFTRYTRFITADPEGPNPESQFKYPDGFALRMLRSDDHGRTWALEEVPEIERLQLREAGTGHGENGEAWLNQREGQFDFTFPELTRDMIGPLDPSGQAWGVFFKAKDPTYVPPTYPRPEGWDNAYPWNSTYLLEYYGRHGFFVSDQTGRNWIQKPWPGDDVFSGSAALFYVPQFQPLNAWGVKMLRFDQIDNSPVMAGPGTFFMVVTQFYKSSENQQQSDAPTRSWVISTVDYGTTWRTSGYLPGGAVKSTVARPYVNSADPGEIYFLDHDTNGALRFYRTTALFESFELVHDDLVPDLYVPDYTAALNTVFIGDNSGAYPPRVRPGFPEFQKP